MTPGLVCMCRKSWKKEHLYILANFEMDYWFYVGWSLPPPPLNLARHIMMIPIIYYGGDIMGGSRLVGPCRRAGHCALCL